MTYQEFSEELKEIRNYIDGRGLLFHPECGTGIRKLDRIAQQMLDYIEQKEEEEEEEYTFSEKSTKEIALNWYSKEEDGYFQDLLGAETLPKSITEKTLKEIGLIFGEDGAEINTQEQVDYLSQFLETKIDLDKYDYALNIFYVYKGENND